MVARERQRHAAPTTADIEHAHARLEQELAGDMGLFLRLRGLERVRRIAEIGTGILFVGVEEEVVELAREVIVMCDVALRPADHVALFQPAADAADMLQRDLPTAEVPDADIREGHVQKPIKIIVFDRQRAVHITLAHAEIGVDRDAPQKAGVGDMDLHGRAGTVAMRTQAAVGHFDLQRTLADDLADHPVE